MSRWGPKQPERLPQSAEEYEAWFQKEVERVKNIPLHVYLKSRPPVVSAWQLEGCRLVLEKRKKEAESPWGI